MPGADALLGPWGFPVIVSVPGWWTLPLTGPVWALRIVAADQSTEAPEVKELGGGGPAEPPTAPTRSRRRVLAPKLGLHLRTVTERPETHLGLQEGGAEQVQSWDP